MTDSTFVSAGPEFVHFARSYQHTAYRLEVRDNYADPGEAEHLQKFLAGQPGDDSWMEDWMGLILRRTLEGQRIERVRVVTEPWSDYTRFGLTCPVSTPQQAKTSATSHATARTNWASQPTTTGCSTRTRCASCATTTRTSYSALT